MAIGLHQLFQGNRKPVAGDVVKEFANYMMYDQYRVYTGSEWITVEAEVIERFPPEQLKAIFQDAHITNERLELKYTDLAAMRECHNQTRAKLDAEYNDLRDKYKIFEILKIDGEQ